MDIRKISIGADYKSSAMHYIINQEVLGGNYHIHLIKHDENSDSIKIWVENTDQEVLESSGRGLKIRSNRKV